MIRFSNYVCLFLALIYCPGVLSKDRPLDIIQEERAAASVLIPLKTDKWTKQAAAWLIEYIKKSSGVELPLFKDDDIPSGNVISVGHTNLVSREKISLDEFRWDDCRLVVRGNILFLVGRDDHGTKTHDWVGARGTCQAVVKFLEQSINARWFLPGPHGDFFDKKINIQVANDLDIISKTAFAYSDGRSVYDENTLDEPGKSLSALANNYRKSVKAAPGGHSYYHAVNTKKYFNDHPEYFALIDGKRTGEGNHLCSSLSNVKELLIDYMQMRFDQGLDWVSLGQEDGYLRCQCDECESKDNYRFRDWHREHRGRWEFYQNTVLPKTPPERLLLLHKQVIDSTLKVNPDQTVMLMCYAPTAWPSHEVKHFGRKRGG